MYPTKVYANKKSQSIDDNHQAMGFFIQLSLCLHLRCLRHFCFLAQYLQSTLQYGSVVQYN